MRVGFLSHNIKTKPVNIHWPFCLWLLWSYLLNFMMVFFTEMAQIFILLATPTWWSALRRSYVWVLDAFKASWILTLDSLQGNGTWLYKCLCFCVCVCGLLPVQSGGLDMLCLLYLLGWWPYEEVLESWHPVSINLDMSSPLSQIVYLTVCLPAKSMLQAGQGKSEWKWRKEEEYKGWGILC